MHSNKYSNAAHTCVWVGQDYLGVGVGEQKIKAYPNKKVIWSKDYFAFSAHASLSVFFAKIILLILQLIIVYIYKKKKYHLKN